MPGSQQAGRRAILSRNSEIFLDKKTLELDLQAMAVRGLLFSEIRDGSSVCLASLALWGGRMSGEILIYLTGSWVSNMIRVQYFPRLNVA